MPLRKPRMKKTYRKKQSNSLVRRIKDLESSVRAEETKKKYTSINEANIALQTAGLPIWSKINAISQGNTANTLTGASYVNRGISYKFLVHNTSGEPAIFRMAILRLKSGVDMDVSGTDLFTGSAGLGLDFSSASDPQRMYLSFNRKKFDVILEEYLKVGAKNSIYTEQFNSNQIIKGYKPFKNRKEFVDTSTGGMDTNYYIIAFAVPAALDQNTGTLEMTGETVVYYKDN